MKNKKQPNIKSYIYKDNKFMFFIALFLSILTAIFSVGVALILKQFIDSIDKGMPRLFFLMYIALAFICLNIFVGIMGIRAQNAYSKKAVKNLKSILMGRILRLKIKDFNKEKTGTYISMLNNDMTSIEQDYIKGGINLVAQVIMVVIALCVMVVLSWKLTIGVLVTCFLPVIITSLFNGKIKKMQELVSQENRTFTTLIKDIFTGNSVIKNFHVEEEVIKISNEKNDVLENQKAKHHNFLGVVVILSQNANMIIVMVIFIIGAWLAIRGEMTVGSILAFIQLLNNVSSPLNQIVENVAKRKASEGLLENFEIISMPDTTYEAKVKKDSFDRGIYIKNVSLSFDKQDVDNNKVLEDINFVFEKGKSYALVGLSGSGKSTLINILAGYYDWYQGEIYYDDLEARCVDEESLCRMLSVVQQDNFIFDDTIEQNIKLFRHWDENLVKKAIQQSGLNKVIEEKGKDSLCGENGMKLSGGERQRISIARALLRGANILLLDEATSALDTVTTQEVESAIFEIEGITKIIITHKINKNSLSKFDGILMLKDGRIVETGTYDELLKLKGEFYSLCRLSG